MRSVSSPQIDFSGVQSDRLVATCIVIASHAQCIVTTDLFQWRAVCQISSHVYCHYITCAVYRHHIDFSGVQSDRLVAMCIVITSHAQCIVTTDRFQWRAVCQISSLVYCHYITFAVYRHHRLISVAWSMSD